MTYGDYLNFLSPGRSDDDQLVTFQRIINGFQEDTLSKATLASYLRQEAPVGIVNHKPEDEHPLIVLSGAHPIYLVELAERFAQSGYRVLSVPRTGKTQGERLPYTAEGVQEYEADLLAVLDQLEHPLKAELAFVSWSFEGLATLHLAAKMPTNIFLSLDGALGYDYGIPLLNESIFTKKLNFPVFHYTGTSSSHGKDLALLKKYADQVRLIQDFDLTHGEFTSISSLTADRLISGDPDKDYEALINDVLTQLKSAFKK